MDKSGPIFWTVCGISPTHKPHKKGGIVRGRRGEDRNGYWTDRQQISTAPAIHTWAPLGKGTLPASSRLQGYSRAVFYKTTWLFLLLQLKGKKSVKLWPILFNKCLESQSWYPGHPPPWLAQEWVRWLQLSLMKHHGKAVSGCMFTGL